MARTSSILRWLRCTVLTPFALPSKPSRRFSGRIVFVQLFIAATVSGCAVGPDYQRPAFHHQEQWHSELTMTRELADTDRTAWWRQFDDPLLNDLTSMAADNNRELAAAMANIEQARALRTTISSAYWPRIDTSADANRTRYSNQGNFGSGTRNNYSANLDASWELDIFGKTRRSVEAADARIGAGVAVRDALRLSVLAETATAYFELRSLQAQHANAVRTIELLREVEAIAQAQLDAGVISEGELLTARGERQLLESQLPGLQADITARIYRISVLTGKPPEYHLKALKEPAALPEIRDRVPLGLRSQLLERRPDIRIAERELAASSADIGAAKAAMFPDFSLTGAIGTTARLFGDLFTMGTVTHSVGAALNWPLFAAGQYSAQVDAAEAGERAALASYEHQILLALEDSENALNRYGQEWKALTQYRAATQSRERAFEIARLRYEAGETDFLTLIDSERSLNTARVNVIQSQQRLLTDLTALYKALGGGWQVD